jgi:hypothetical protein
MPAKGFESSIPQFHTTVCGSADAVGIHSVLQGVDLGALTNRSLSEVYPLHGTTPAVAVIFNRRLATIVPQRIATTPGILVAS